MPTSLRRRQKTFIARSRRSPKGFRPVIRQSQRSILRTQQLELTPQESEQLSQYVSDDNYVKKQKQDIEELSSMFRGMMGKEAQESATEYIMEFQSHFAPQPDFSARYLFMIGGKKKAFVCRCGWR